MVGFSRSEGGDDIATCYWIVSVSRSPDIVRSGPVSSGRLQGGDTGGKCHDHVVIEEQVKKQLNEVCCGV